MPEQPDTSYTIDVDGHTYKLVPSFGAYARGAFLTRHAGGDVKFVKIAPAALAKLAQALQSAAEMAEND